jgi:hypothetical protein
VVAVAAGAAEGKVVAVRAAEDKVVVVVAAEDKVVPGVDAAANAGGRADWDAGRVATVCARNAERPCPTSRVSPVS